MIYDFKISTNRENSNCEKYRLREKLFGTKDVIPAWVADMDIDTPDFILDAIKDRLEDKIIGYEEIPKELFLAQIDWFKTRHNTLFGLEDIFYIPSVVTSIRLVIEAFTSKGDGVVVQTPVYPPFFQSVIDLDRKVVKNSLKLKDDGKYYIDFEDLENKIQKDTKLLLLCSPHNPVGRVWQKEELERLFSICKKHNILIFSDEIHCDLVYKPYKHISSLNIDKDMVISAIGSGKTFNMAGFSMSSLVITNDKLKEKFINTYKKIHFPQSSVLSNVAVQRAYEDGSNWLDQLLIHLQKNYNLLNKTLKRYSNFIKLTPIEATYLGWLDCRGMGLTNRELKDFFIKEARLGLNLGIAFGHEGSLFVRLNFAVSKDIMDQIVERIDDALSRRYSA